MNAKELFEKSRKLFNDKLSSKVYDSSYLEHINVLLAETFHENNAHRESLKKNHLTEIPQVTTETDEIPYEPIMLHLILPKGLAARLVLDDSPEKYQVYQQEYLNERSATMPCIYTEGWE